MNNKITADVRFTKDHEGVKVSAKDKKYLSLKSMVEDTNDGPRWFDGVAFGDFADLLASNLKKGVEARVEGKLTIKEYQKNDGSVGTSNSLVVTKVTLVGGKVLDQFSSSNTGVKTAKMDEAPF